MSVFDIFSCILKGYSRANYYQLSPILELLINQLFSSLSFSKLTNPNCGLVLLWQGSVILGVIPGQLTPIPNTSPEPHIPTSSNPVVNIVDRTQLSIPQNDCPGRTIKKYCLNQVLMHVPHAVSRNILKRIANMGLLNHAKTLKVEDSI